MAEQFENVMPIVGEAGDQTTNPDQLRETRNRLSQQADQLDSFYRRLSALSGSTASRKVYSSLVWRCAWRLDVCLLFFQVLLLGGNAYSHFVAMRLSPLKQSRLQQWDLICSVVLLILMSFFWPSPITPGFA